MSGRAECDLRGGRIVYGLLAALALAGCGDGRHAAADAAEPPDAAPADAVDAAVDAAPDADLINFTLSGTYLDWDSSAAAPCPIAGATWTAHYDTARVAVTDASGVFTIRLASYLAHLDIADPVAPSPCANPPGRYEIASLAIIPPVMYYAGGRFVARSLTAERLAPFYAQIGEPFDATRAQLLVHVDGPPREVAISLPHAAAQAFDGAAWAAGASGGEVFFPNIDTSGGEMANVTVAGGALGTGSVILTAGAILDMTVITR